MEAASDAASPTATTIQSVARAARLLLRVAAVPVGITAAQAAAEIGVTQSTAYHLLNTLRGEGLLAKAGTQFVLGSRAAVIADAWLRSDEAPAFLLEPLRALAAETGETAYLAAWCDDGIRALASVGGVRAVRVAAAARGPYRAPHARATGKLLLAYADGARRAQALGTGPLEALTPNTITDRRRLDEHLAAIRHAGWAEDHEEFLEGVSCIAAPVVLDGTVVAALTVSAPTQRFDRHRDLLRDAVLRAAGAAGDEHPTRPEEAA